MNIPYSQVYTYISHQIEPDCIVDRAEQNRTGQDRAEQNRAEQNRRDCIVLSSLRYKRTINIRVERAKRLAESHSLCSPNSKSESNPKKSHLWTVRFCPLYPFVDTIGASQRPRGAPFGALRTRPIDKSVLKYRGRKKNLIRTIKNSLLYTAAYT